MATKTTGAEFKAFYSDPLWWPEGIWHEDEEVTICGLEPPDDFDLADVADAAILVISGGYVSDADSNDLGSFEGYFRKWRKKQTTATFLVECDLAKVGYVKACVKTAGGKVKG